MWETDIKWDSPNISNDCVTQFNFHVASKQKAVAERRAASGITFPNCFVLIIRIQHEPGTSRVRSLSRCKGPPSVTGPLLSIVWFISRLLVENISLLSSFLFCPVFWLSQQKMFHDPLLLLPAAAPDPLITLVRKKKRKKRSRDFTIWTDITECHSYIVISCAREK